MIFVECSNLIFSNSNLLTILGELNSLPSILSNWRLLGLVLFIVLIIIYILKNNRLKAFQNISEQGLDIQNLQERVQEQTLEVTAVAQEKVNVILEEYQRLLPYAEELGLTVDSFSIEAGILPQIKTSLRGSIEDIDIESLERIKASNKNNKLLIAVFNAIVLAKKCHEKLESAYISILKDIVIDIKLGLPPAISIRFQ